MAYKDSGEMPVNQGYMLGDYIFSITVTQDPGEAETGINVRCDKGEERAVVSSEVTGTVEGWCVEANETTADVYVVMTDIEEPTFPFGSTGSITGNEKIQGGYTNTYEAPALTFIWSGGNSATYIFASPEPGQAATIIDNNPLNPGIISVPMSTAFSLAGKTVYYTTYNSEWTTITSAWPATASIEQSVAMMAWRMIYGGAIAPVQLVARFAIDLHDAGGTGTDSDWEDPGDYDTDNPDPYDPDNPRTTLELAVTGASAGTHSALPADKATVKPYGCGGDGGNGGGGGAGASTVIVRRFATDRADSKKITATARPHGYGSGGGKGGKGGDGCVLIFY